MIQDNSLKNVLVSVFFLSVNSFLPDVLLSRAEAHSPTHGFSHTHFLPSIFSAFCSCQKQNCERKREDKEDRETEDRIQADEGVSDEMEGRRGAAFLPSES